MPHTGIHPCKCTRRSTLVEAPTPCTAQPRRARGRGHAASHPPFPTSPPRGADPSEGGTLTAPLRAHAHSRVPCTRGVTHTVLPPDTPPHTHTPPNQEMQTQMKALHQHFRAHPRTHPTCE